MDVSIVVPCYPPHREKIPQLLHNLKRQTMPWREIIIALSETTKEEGEEFRVQWEKETGVSVRVVANPFQCYSARNRNEGASEALGEWLLFLDADDKYHKKLIERLSWYIDNQESDVMIMTSAKEYDDEDIRAVSSYVIRENQLCEWIEKHEGFVDTKELYEINTSFENIMKKECKEDWGPISHGHVCMRYREWESRPQEDMEIKKEDSIYLRKLLQDGKKVRILPDQLTFYSKL
jgi:glycosyltransferase involved in cell wall biosynthesis